MAFADALPNFREIPGQLRKDMGEDWFEYSGTVLVTLGMIASLLIAGASLLLIVGFGTDLADSVLGFTVGVPLIGATQIVPGLALAGAVVAALIAMRLMTVTQERIIDDVNGIFLFNTITFFAAAWSTNLDLPNSISFAFVMIAGVFLLTWLLGVYIERR